MASFHFLGLLLIVLIVIPQGLAQYGYGPLPTPYGTQPPPHKKLPVYTPSMKKAPVEKPPVYKPPVEKPSVFKPLVKKPHVRKPRVEKP